MLDCCHGNQSCDERSVVFSPISFSQGREIGWRLNWCNSSCQHCGTPVALHREQTHLCLKGIAHRVAGKRPHLPSLRQDAHRHSSAMCFTANEYPLGLPWVLWASYTNERSLKRGHGTWFLSARKPHLMGGLELSSRVAESVGTACASWRGYLNRRASSWPLLRAACCVGYSANLHLATEVCCLECIGKGKHLLIFYVRLVNSLVLWHIPMGENVFH